MCKTKHRFDQYYDKTANGCWEWNGALTLNGYGKFWLNDKTISSHRASYLIHKGEIPDDKLVLHTCDNAKCVNPDHLVLGTHRDNVRHMQERNRFLTGEKNSSCTITTDTARQIIQRLIAGGRVRTIARELGCTRATVTGIAGKVTWKHIWKEFDTASE